METAGLGRTERREGLLQRKCEGLNGLSQIGREQQTTETHEDGDSGLGGEEQGERHGDREAERDAERETERRGDTETERQRDRETER